MKNSLTPIFGNLPPSLRRLSANRIGSVLTRLNLLLNQYSFIQKLRKVPQSLARAQQLLASAGQMLRRVGQSLSGAGQCLAEVAQSLFTAGQSLGNLAQKLFETDHLPRSPPFGVKTH